MQLDRDNLAIRLAAKTERGRKFTLNLREKEDERVQMTNRVRRELEERIEYTDRRLQLTDLERRQLIDMLEVTKREKEELTSRLEVTEKEKKELSSRLTDSNEGRKRVTGRLETMEMEERKLEEALKTPPDRAREEDTPLKDEETTSKIPEESVALAADYGKLMSHVAEDLTLDHTLRLALLYRLPESEKDMLRRISLVEIPGIKFTDFMKTRNIINMYDVTNLQKGLLHLQLHSTNTKYVEPYQQKVDPFQFEENRSPELVDWPDEATDALKANDTSLNRDSERREWRSQNDPDKDRLREKMKREETIRRYSQNMDMAQPYIEHKITCEGGTITLTGMTLSIPDEALSADHVIAVTVIRDPDVPLPGGTQRRRMTPLIKLEPEGLQLNKPARLTIPHSAIIPEPDRHSVTIFTGQATKAMSQKGIITWREEKSPKWKLEQENISVDINTLSYVFVNLVSQHKEQKHVFRVVPFIDGIPNTKHDLLITVCFCKDNDAEYQLLLDDYQSKLASGSYRTFQVSRILSEDKDEMSYVSVIMSSQIHDYHLTEENATKMVDVDHLCAASRVSLQFRFKRRKDGDDDMVDIRLEVSQGGKKKTDFDIKFELKQILLSRESQRFLHRKLPSEDLQRYESLKDTVSRDLHKEHCEKLATFFELTPAETDKIFNDSEPGGVLLKIFEERKIITPDKVFGIYQALQSCHLYKIGRHVMGYIDESQKEKVKSTRNVREKKRTATKTEPVDEKHFKLTRNAIQLIDEGYERLDVQRALKLSHGKLDLGRSLLVFAKEEHERLPLPSGSNVYKEQYIDELGGELHIAGIHLLVPPGALNTGRVVSLTVSAEDGSRGPIASSSLRLTPLVNFGPMNIVLQKPVIIIIPHCGFIASNQTGLDVYSGISQKDKTIKWSLERKYLSCSMSRNYLRVEIQRPCGIIGPHIPFHPKMMKHVCVAPIKKETPSSEDELTISLWFYNDDKLEHDSFVHEEIYKNKGTVLHDPVPFQLKTMGSTLSVSINSSGSTHFDINPKSLTVDVDSLWLLDRQKFTFRVQTKDTDDAVTLDIKSRYGVTDKILFQFSIPLNVDDMHRLERTTSPFQQVLSKVTLGSFKELLKKIAEMVDTEESIDLAKNFQLTEDVIARIRAHRKPGILLMEMLNEECLTSAANISRLEYALTEIGNEQCAKIVREFRRTNPVVHPTMVPGDHK